MLQGRAAGARVRSRRQPRRPLGRSRCRATNGRCEPRHHGRLQGQRLDWRQRPEGRAGPEVHARRQVPAAGRPSRQERRQQRHGELLARREGLRRSEDERGVRRRRLRQQARRRSSTRTRASSSATGAPTATSRTTPTSDRTIRRRRRRSSSAVRCTAPTSRTTASCTCATAPTIASRCSSATARSSRRCSSRRARSATAPCGTSRSRGIPQQKFLFVADGRNEKVYIVLREHAAGAHELRRRRPAARSVLRRPQHRDRLARQRLHDRDVRGQTPAEVRLQGPRARSPSRTRARCGRDQSTGATGTTGATGPKERASAGHLFLSTCERAEANEPRERSGALGPRE